MDKSALRNSVLYYQNRNLLQPIFPFEAVENQPNLKQYQNDKFLGK